MFPSVLDFPVTFKKNSNGFQVKKKELVFIKEKNVL